MRRLSTAILAAVAVLACACAASASAAGGPSASAGAPARTSSSPSPPAGNPARAQLQGYSCQRAQDPADRSVSVKAVMRPLAGTRKLAIRFQLLEQTPGSSTAPTVVRASGLDVWINPKNSTLGQLPGDVWVLNKSVINLDAPATYRFRVSFRWTGAHGAVLGTSARYSSRCIQRELRPDLAVSSIAVAPVAGHPDENLYSAIVANRGATRTGPFEVLFTPGDGTAPQSRTVNDLRAGQTRTELFTGPVCNPAEPPTVTADATNEVNDDNLANNEMTAACPS